MPSNQKSSASAMEIDRLAIQLAKDPQSKVFLPLAEEYCKSGMWQEAAAVLEDGLKYYPGFITAMVVLGRAYDQLGQATKAKAILEEAVKLSPDNLRAHRILMKIFVAQGLMSEALKSCDVVLNLSPRDEEARVVRAKLGKAAGDATVPQANQASAGHDVSTAAQADPSPGSVAGSVADLMEEEAAGLSVTGEPTRQENGAPDSPSAPSHARLIAQLESWLRSIERERLDQPDAESDSSTSQ